MIYQTFDIATSILVGTLFAFVTGYALATITHYTLKPRKTAEQTVTEHIIYVLHRQGALMAISAGLSSMDHPDADLFINAISVIYANREDEVVNEWIIRAVMILSADINNRIDAIVLNKNVDILNYINDNYETKSDSDDDSDVDDNTSDNNNSESSESSEQSEQESENSATATSNTEAPVENSGTESESDAEEPQTSGSSSPIRVRRALTHYSDSSSNENTGTASIPPSSDASSADDAVDPTKGDSDPSESINSTSESSTDSVEDSGNSEKNSENS